MKIVRLITTMMLFTALSLSSFANGWLVPPDFQVQRDVLYLLDSPSVTPIYSGPDDPVLWQSDFIEWEGVDWFQGGVGIDNRQGTDDRTGWLLLHLDNWPIPRPIKHIWFQGQGVEIGGGDVVLSVINAGGAAVPWDTVDLVYNGDYFTHVGKTTIKPNPPYEEFLFQFTVPVGGIAWVDSFHVATACVPEPATLSLFGIGVVGLALRRLKRK